MKCWLAQGSSGRRVTLLLGTTFLHINGALDSSRGFRMASRDFDEPAKHVTTRDLSQTETLFTYPSRARIRSCGPFREKPYHKDQ